MKITLYGSYNFMFIHDHAYFFDFALISLRIYKKNILVFK
jgi:hypothetical protein